MQIAFIYTAPLLPEEGLPTGCRSAERGQDVRKALGGAGGEV